MPEFNLKKRDINMGDEDSWDLIISDDLSSAHITHWWSHRSGGIIAFNGDSCDIPLEKFKQSNPDLYQIAKRILVEMKFKGIVP